MTRKERPYADILRAIADGKAIQFQNAPGRWDNTPVGKFFTDLHYGGRNLHRFRVKPPVILINGHEVPEPLRELPEKMLGEVLYHPAFHAEELELKSIVSQTIAGSVLSNKLLLLGILHPTFDAARIHAKALLSFATTVDIDGDFSDISKATGQEGAL